MKKTQFKNILIFGASQGIGKALAEKISVGNVLDFYKRFRDNKTEL